MFDAVVMSPPWNAAAGSPGSRLDRWLEHVWLAWRLLRPGGWLVAVVPDSVASRSDAQYQQARVFIEHHGSHTPLPACAFAESRSAVTCRIVRLAKPLWSGRPEYLLTTPQQPAVRVERPVFTGAAAAGRPVQVWSGGWGGRDRVVRYRGRCVACRWLPWGCDDGDNDPRGVLGEFGAGYSLDPDEYGMTRPQIGLCHRCGNDGEHLRAAHQHAVSHWTQPGARAP
ncbi:hypothetical protein ABZS66_28105 [Dactylosporangium sp. NPDC005572]|uniref:hypothetical protein n=1 Tax=Dactylosporangium sp. NPDC005572 TaxID=3156889 RepID=UPI0033AF7D5B